MTSTSLVIAALFIVSRTWKQLETSVKGRMDEQAWRSHMIDYSSAGREQKQATDPSHSMDQSHRYKAEGKKPDSREYVLYDSLYMKFKDS